MNAMKGKKTKHYQEKLKKRLHLEQMKWRLSKQNCSQPF